MSLPPKDLFYTYNCRSPLLSQIPKALYLYLYYGSYYMIKWLRVLLLIVINPISISAPPRFQCFRKERGNKAFGRKLCKGLKQFGKMKTRPKTIQERQVYFEHILIVDLNTGREITEGHLNGQCKKHATMLCSECNSYLYLLTPHSSKGCNWWRKGGFRDGNYNKDQCATFTVFDTENPQQRYI